MSRNGAQFEIFPFVNTNKGEKGCFFCIPLPAGPYEFYAFEFYNFEGGGSGYSIKEDYHFSLPFELSPGEVVYIGRLKLTTAWGKNIFGMDVGGPGFLILSEDSVNDVEEALMKCPESVRGRKVRIAPVKAASMAKKTVWYMTNNIYVNLFITSVFAPMRLCRAGATDRYIAEGN